MNQIKNIDFTVLAINDTDDAKIAKAKSASLNKLKKLRDSIISKEKKCSKTDLEIHVNDFKITYNNTRLLLLKHNVILSEFVNDQPANEEEIIQPPAEFLALAPAPLKFSRGDNDEQLDDAIESLFLETCEKYNNLDAESRIKNSIMAVVLFLNDRFVDLTQMDLGVLFIMKSSDGSFNYGYANHQKLKHMFGETEYFGKTYKWGDIWYKSKQRRKQDSASLLPPKFLGDDNLNVPNGIFNLWNDFAIPLQHAIDEGGRADGPGATAFINTIDTILSQHTKQERHYLISYLAHVLQSPGELPGICLVFQGDEGAGKGALVSIVSKICVYRF